MWFNTLLTSLKVGIGLSGKQLLGSKQSFDKRVLPEKQCSIFLRALKVFAKDRHPKVLSRKAFILKNSQNAFEVLQSKIS